MARNKTNHIIWHHAATKPDMNIGAADIDMWHKARGFNGVGYHRVVRRDGTVEQGRKDDAIGAHCKGYNDQSYGVCIVGGIGDDGQPELNFTDAQYRAIRIEAARLSVLYPNATHVGHRDLAPTLCPGFDIRVYLENHVELSEPDVVPHELSDVATRNALARALDDLRSATVEMERLRHKIRAARGVLLEERSSDELPK
tara:strand:+ start:567 stop:1163 length:597 start_codon:yes stop_codon:yes gene_type:complete